MDTTKTYEDIEEEYRIKPGHLYFIEAVTNLVTAQKKDGKNIDICLDKLVNYLARLASIETLRQLFDSDDELGMSAHLSLKLITQILLDK